MRFAPREMNELLAQKEEQIEKLNTELRGVKELSELRHSDNLAKQKTIYVFEQTVKRKDENIRILKMRLSVIEGVANGIKGAAGLLHDLVIIPETLI